HVANAHSFRSQERGGAGLHSGRGFVYVGPLCRHLPEEIDPNAIPYGALFNTAARGRSQFAGNTVPANGDSTIAQAYTSAGLKFDGSKALAADFLRRFHGYTTIRFNTFIRSSHF